MVLIFLKIMWLRSKYKIDSSKIYGENFIQLKHTTTWRNIKCLTPLSIAPNLR